MTGEKKDNYLCFLREKLKEKDRIMCENSTSVIIYPTMATIMQVEK